jgi:hypothetical protein
LSFLFFRALGTFPVAVPYNTCGLSPADYSQLIANQNSVITLSIVQFLALNSPWANLLDSGTVDYNIGENIVSLASPRTAIGQSLVAPAFGNLSQACGTTGNMAQWGQFEYVTKLQLLRGTSQPICVNANRYSVKNSLSQAVENMKRSITDVYNADVRAQVLALSGTKAVLRNTDTQVSQALTGGEWAISAPWRGGVPTGGLTFSWLKSLSDYARYNYQPMMYGQGADEHALFIGSPEIVDVLRNQAPVNNVLSVTTTGGFKDGKDSLWDYAWVDVNFRGIMMGIDPKPLRFDTVDASGAPIFIEPYNKVAPDFGFFNANNPHYLGATYEIGFLCYKNSFKRLVPAKYSGEGDAKWATQMFGGELIWRNVLDNACNAWQDFGNFLYQIARAYQANMPHCVVPIAFKRCLGDNQPSTCTGVTDVTI